MRRIVLLVALAFMIGGGAVLTAAQSDTDSQTEETDIGAQAVECATPGASPGASPDLAVLEDVGATAIASPELIAELATAIASPGASPAVPEDPCATPVIGTPAS